MVLLLAHWPAGAQDFMFEIDDQTVAYEPAAPAGTFEVVVQMHETPAGSDYATTGFRFGIESDPDFVVACETPPDCS